MSTLQQLLDTEVGKAGEPGAVALVVRDGEVERAASGHLDAERSAPMRHDSIFRIASIAKPLTAAAVLILVDDGVLRLEDPVDQWLPELADHRVVRTPSSPVEDTVPARRPVTVEDLLTNRAGWGFPDDFSLPGVSPLVERMRQGPPQPQNIAPPDEWMATLAGIPALHHPGDAWLYNLCSDLQGVLVARASGRSLPDFLTERLLGPLGMSDTGFGVPDAALSRFTSYYRQGEDEPELVDRPDGQWRTEPAFPSGAGGHVSTVGDWYAFLSLLLHDGVTASGDRLLSAGAVAAMRTDHLTVAQRQGGELFLEGQGWGYGGSVDVTRRDPWNVPGRYGWVGGTGTTAHLVPSTGSVAILMTQLEMTSPTPTPLMRAFWTYAAR